MKSLISTIIEIHKEQALRHKALRLLSKQTWSIEFLSALVAEAAKLCDRGIVLTITNKDGMSMSISTATATNKFDCSDSIFDKLDDEAAIESFIAKHTTR